MAGSNSSGQESSRPVLRVNTSLATPTVTQSGQNGDPISVSSSPSSSPTPIATAQPTATATQNQVSSAMPPPPRPVVDGTWIQPFELPANAPPADPHANFRARRALENSGVSVMTEYPLSTSPRASKEDANRTLNEVAAYDYMFRPCTHMTPGAVVADSKTNYKGNAYLTQKVVVANPDFQSLAGTALSSLGLRPRGPTGSKTTSLLEPKSKRMCFLEPRSHRTRGSMTTCQRSKMALVRRHEFFLFLHAIHFLLLSYQSKQLDTLHSQHRSHG
jgi:hypothetical protein